MRLDENGRWVPLLPDAAEAKPTSEAAKRPPTPDDPRNPNAAPE
jgi:hypothetical protein